MLLSAGMVFPNMVRIINGQTLKKNVLLIVRVLYTKYEYKFYNIIYFIIFIIFIIVIVIVIVIIAMVTESLYSTIEFVDSRHVV